jgi:hypothetical protein
VGVGGGPENRTPCASERGGGCNLLAQICLDGQISDLPVQPLSQKYFASRFDQISFLICPIPSHTEGRFAIVTDVGGGMRWTLTMLLTTALDADGEVVWS